MPTIGFAGVHGYMAGTVSNVPAFPGETFSLGLPEAIGDSAMAHWSDTIKPDWRQEGDSWISTGRREGELAYVLKVEPQSDTVDIRIRLINESTRTWANGMAFNCFNCAAVPIRDFECVRHWVAQSGKLRRLVELPRKFGPRPTVQLYSVEGAPLGRAIPFVAGFDATPDAVLEGWMAIQSHDSKRLVAVVSKPALFLFQNMEYSCIHSAPDFGRMRPGDTREALTRLYFVESTLKDWYRRMREEMAAV